MNQWLSRVDSRDISVVIQGPLYRQLSPARGIDGCVAAIRKHLPYAEIIVSTWADEVLSDIDADHIVTATDPGVLLDFNGNRHNTNRQIVSTVIGIRAASRDYVLKLRSDHTLTGSRIAIMGAYDAALPPGKRLFKQPITVSTLFIRNPAKAPLLFHISDLVHFGTREDMFDFWDQPLKNQDEVFAKQPNMNPIGNFVGCSAMRMVPEQSLMLGFLAKKGFAIDLKVPCKISPELVKLSENFLAENFTILDWQDCQIDFPERFLKSGYSLNTVYGAKELKSVAALEPFSQNARYRKIWLNKYVFNFVRLAWWFSLASIMLNALSPSLAKIARATFRKIRGLEHPNNDRV